jgi:hypothetical protein
VKQTVKMLLTVWLQAVIPQRKRGTDWLQAMNHLTFLRQLWVAPLHFAGRLVKPNLRRWKMQKEQNNGLML